MARCGGPRSHLPRNSQREEANHGRCNKAALADGEVVLPVPERLDDERLFREELIANYGGKCSPLQSFSAEELEKATSRYSPDSILSCSNVGIWYRGNLGNGVLVSVCKTERANYVVVKIAAELSSCQNVWKLLGFCLEKTVRTLVLDTFQPPPYRRELDTFQPPSLPFFFTLPWSRRLKIAVQIAEGVATRTDSLQNVFLDYVPKLANQSIMVNHRAPTNLILKYFNLI